VFSSRASKWNLTREAMQPSHPQLRNLTDVQSSLRYNSPRCPRAGTNASQKMIRDASGRAQK
jgi:hypothetical protein